MIAKEGIMNLSERKKKILAIVVDEYINTAAPVSSKNIADNYLPAVSSATVRSELAALEELGFLTQLHTSSGRVPSPLAYQLYVSELMEKGALTEGETDYIRRIFAEKADSLENVVKSAVKIISELTNYTSIGLSPLDEDDVVENIRLFRVKPEAALLIVVTERSYLKDNVIAVPADMTDENLESAGKMINRLFSGRRLGDIPAVGAEAEKEFAAYREVFDRVLEALGNYRAARENEIVLAGEDKIFRHPEYDNVESVKNFLSVVSSKEKLAELLDVDGNIEISVKIGRENSEDIPEDCSLVTAAYSAGGVKLGTFGVLGPIRMDYQKVITVLENVGKMLESIVNNK